MNKTTKGTIKGLLKQSGKSSTLFSMKVDENVLGICESVVLILQHLCTTVWNWLRSWRTLFQKSEVRKVSITIMVKYPLLTLFQTPRQLLSLSIMTGYQYFFSIADVVENELDHYFQQEILHICSELKNLQLSAVSCKTKLANLRPSLSSNFLLANKQKKKLCSNNSMALLKNGELQMRLFIGNKTFHEDAQTIFIAQVFMHMHYSTVLWYGATSWNGKMHWTFSILQLILSLHQSREYS